MEDKVQKITGTYYGKINFLGNNGIIGETIYYKDKQAFDREISESSHVGRPIEYEIFL